MRAVGPRDAVVTGTGVVTALGFGTQAVFDALDAGRVAVRSMGDADAAASRAFGAPVEEPYLRVSVPREMEAQIKFLNGSGELAVEATAEAAAHAGLLEAGVDPARRGLYLSQMDSGDWGCSDFRQAVAVATDGFEKPLEAEALNRAAARHVKPFFMLESLKNNAFSFLATMFELRGANTSVAGFSSPTHEALSMGARSVTRGTLDTSLVVAAARLSTGSARLEMDDVGFSKLPDHAIPGDGAAALVIERAESAKARDREVLAAVLGHATATRQPSEGPWAPSAEALHDAGARALAEAECGPGDLLGIVAPDGADAGLDGVPTVSWQEATGHLALASTGVECALAARAVQLGRLPGAGNQGPGKAVLVLTAGLLGHAGALVLAPA